jgi:hypothetical protein
LKDEKKKLNMKSLRKRNKDGGATSGSEEEQSD